VLARLDAYSDPNERRYYLTRESVERAIAEETAKVVKNNPSSEPVGNIPKNAGHPSEKSLESAEDESDRVHELEQEVMDLKITNRGKDYFIDQLKGERESFAQERKEYVGKLIEAHRKVGELETKLLQLAPPVDGRTAAEGNVGARDTVSPTGP
jgi:DNA repair exonuclease SbcCD ATPase subunit